MGGLVMKHILQLFLRPDQWLLFSAVALWAILAIVLGFPDPSLGLLLSGSYGVLIGVLSISLLRYLGYFQALRPYPRKSDLLLLVVSSLIAVSLALLLHIFLGGVTNLTMLYAVPSALLLSIVLFWLDHRLHDIKHRYQKRKVVLDLLPLESIRLIKELVELDYLSHLELLTRKDLERSLRRGEEQQIELIIMSRSSWNEREFHDCVVRAHLSGIPVREHHDVMQDLTGRLSLESDDLWTFLTGARRQTVSLQGYQVLKNALEPVLAAILMVLLAPLIAVIALLIKLEGSGPVLYSQRRRGYMGRSFTLYKFRSMRQNSEINGPQWSPVSDDRVTKLGKVLRRLRLDEIPQLYNVIRGEMSFCGPRPERPEMYSSLKQEIPHFHLRTLVRPGITGWAQISAGYASSIEESQLKLEYDLYYIKHKSPRLDLIIILKTAMLSFLGVENKSYRAKLLFQKYLYARTSY